MKVKIIHTILLTFFIAAVGWCQQKEVIIPFSNPAGEKELKINVTTGSIVIKGVDRTDILVKYSIEENDDDEDHGNENSGKRKGLKKIKGSNFSYEMSESDNHAYIESGSWFQQMNLVIEVPRKIDINIVKSMGEKVEISNVTGNVNVESNMGDCILTGIDGLANVNSNCGSIKVSFSKIPALKAMYFTTTMGDVEVSLPQNISADLKLKTDWGDVYTDMDIQLNNSEPEYSKKDGKGHFKVVSKSWTTGKLNTGGPELTLKTKMGDVILRKNE